MFFFSFLLLSSSSAVVAADDAVFGVSGVCVCVCVCVCVVAVNAEVNNRRPVSGTSLTAPTPLDYLFIFFSISSFLSRKRTPVILADRPRRKNEKLGNKKKGCVFLFLFPRFCFVFFAFRFFSAFVRENVATLASSILLDAVLTVQLVPRATAFPVAPSTVLARCFHLLHLVHLLLHHHPALLLRSLRCHGRRRLPRPSRR